MGKFNGRLLTLFIAPDGVRVCEGENRNGNLDISKFFVVSGVQDYFQSVPGKPAEISNMTGLVSAIIEECKNRRVNTRRLLIASNCFGIESAVDLGTSSVSLKGILTGDIKDALASIVKRSEKPIPGVMMCTRDWGTLTMDNVLKHVSTKTMGDTFLLKSMVQEFYKRGYEVVYLCGSREVLLNFKQTERANFDSQGKIIIDVDYNICISTFIKDTLYSIEQFPLMDPSTVTERILNLANQRLGVTGRNPKVYFSGPIFQNTRLYNEACEAFEVAGYSVYDLFNRPDIPEGYEEACAAGDMSPIITPDYSANLSMLMCGYAKTLISLTPTLAMTDLFRQNSKAGAALFVGCSALLFVVSAAWGVQTLVHLREMQRNPSKADDYQAQVITLTAKQASLQSTINTLTKADTTILDLIAFIDDHQMPDINIVSVDTADMLRNEFSVSESIYSEDGVVSGSAGGTSDVKNRDSIIIRGYAKSGTAAITYFDKLFKSDLPVDPVLKGIERYVLPVGDEVYIFEIEVGGVVN